MTGRFRVALGAVVSGAVAVTGCTIERDEARTEYPDTTIPTTTMPPTTTVSPTPVPAEPELMTPPRVVVAESPTVMPVDLPGPLRSVEFGPRSQPSATDQGIGIRLRMATGENIEFWILDDSTHNDRFSPGQAFHLGSTSRSPDWWSNREPDAFDCDVTRRMPSIADEMLAECVLYERSERVRFELDGSDLRLTAIDAVRPLEPQPLARWRATGPITGVEFIGLGRTALARDNDLGDGCTSATAAPWLHDVRFETQEGAVAIPDLEVVGQAMTVTRRQPSGTEPAPYIVECEEPTLRVSDGSVTMGWESPPTRELRAWRYDLDEPPKYSEEDPGRARVRLETSDPVIGDIADQTLDAAADGDIAALGQVQRAVGTWGGIVVGRHSYQGMPFPSVVPGVTMDGFWGAAGPDEVCQVRPADIPTLLCVFPESGAGTGGARSL